MSASSQRSITCSVLSRGLVGIGLAAIASGLYQRPSTAQTPECKSRQTITVTGVIDKVLTFDQGQLLALFVEKGAKPCHPGVVHTKPGPGREKCVPKARVVATGKMDFGDEGDALIASQVKCD